MTRDQRVRVVLVDDHGMVRQGLCSLLSEQSWIDVVGQCGRAAEVAGTVESCRPDVVVMDISMPDLNGIEATRQLVARHPDIAIVALSVHRDELFVAEMFRAGARGYVLKESVVDELIRAIETVAQGRRFLAEQLVRRGDEAMLESLERDGFVTPIESLTPRQRQILGAIAEGQSTRQIAAQLGVSTKAVEAARRKLMETLHAPTVAELVKTALRAQANRPTGEPTA